MKIARHKKILEIVKNNDIETQEELMNELIKNNINVTQATVSRDIKELNIVKVLSSNNTYIYSVVNLNNDLSQNKIAYILFSTILNISSVDNFITIKTTAGSGNLVGELIDLLNFKEIAGTVAGNNTVFILCRSNEDVNNILYKINKLKVIK